jgi:hypothetical protein
VKRALALAVLGILLLTAGAIFLIDRLDATGSTRSSTDPRLPEPLPATPGPVATSAGGLAPPAAPPLPPGVVVETGPTPPPMPANPEKRSDAILELREQRRTGAFEQQNAREAARRARLGLPPAPQPPARPQPVAPSGDSR